MIKTILQTENECIPIGKLSQIHFESRFQCNGVQGGGGGGGGGLILKGPKIFLKK